MDNSLYGDTRHGYDYKQYHYVACTCPCERYCQSIKRGICERCSHPKKPCGIIQIKKNGRGLQYQQICQFISNALHKNNQIEKRSIKAFIK